MKIAIATDHAGVEYKKELITFLESEGYEVENFGTDNTDSCDYADYAYPAAKSVSNGKNDRGIIFCGSGIGVSLVANKVKGIRAALVYNEETSKLCRLHNDANIMCFGARFFDVNTAKEMIINFLETEFEGGRHQRRVDKIHSLTNN